MKNLKQKALSGIIWSALQRYSKMFISFISGIILARLLTPYDYGCIGMLMIFMFLAESFIDGGFGSALIQKKYPTQEDYSTIFFWNLGMAVLLYVILYFSAPAISRFYRIPLLSSVLRVQGIVLFLFAFNIVQSNQLRKKLNFRVLSVVTITTSIVSLVVTIIMAYNGYGVWALVAQNILTAAIPALIFWFYVKWRPQLTFSWQSFRELFSFGFYMFLISLMSQFGRQIQGLLIGRFYNPETMGFYSKASATEKLSSQSISQIITQVTYPLYAAVQDDKQTLCIIIRKLMMVISYITFPLMFVLMLCAKPLFILLYSDRWTDSVPYFQVLCLSGLAFCLQSVNKQSIAAIGKSKTLFIWTVVKRVVGISLTVLGFLLFGMKGLLAGVVFHTWFSFAVNIGLVSKYIGYKWWRQMFDILPVFSISITIALISYGVGLLGYQQLYLNGLVMMLTYVSLYIAWSLVFKPEAFCSLKNSLDELIEKSKNR